MIGHRVDVALALAVFPSPLVAQVEISVGGGIHVDRAREHDRVVTDGGTGNSLRSRDTDVGGVLEASARLRIVRRLSFQVAVSNYLYGSSYFGETRRWASPRAPRAVSSATTCCSSRGW